MNNLTVRDASSSNVVFTFEQFLLGMFSCSVMYVIVSAFGILTNLINIRTFIIMGLNDAMTVSFLLLSVSDLTFLVVSLGAGVGGILYVSELMFDEWFLIDPTLIALLSTNLFIPLSAAVSINTSFTSVARCMCVALPFYFKNMFKRKTSIMFMSASLVFCEMVYVPVYTCMVVIDRFDPVHDVSRPSVIVSSDLEYIKNIVWEICGMGIPLIAQATIIASTIILARSLIKSHRFRSANGQSNLYYDRKLTEKSLIKQMYKDTHSGHIGGKERQVVKQVVLISLVYIFCNTPKILFILAGFFIPEFAVNGPLYPIYVTVSSVRMVFEMLYPALSLPIYYTYNSKFRGHCGF